ncbi:D-alanyl-D-alanine carboxypeptidase (penicillin-binding protein 5/6) [Loktanella sp. DSM 29012]|uniref:D-alanyl-D-alanine carboxypeptidase family protein n=1 Tax=Loktanella sp. DSM 29012 TaxID=1881056 RepID=UPI0008BE6896|nr:D-alanyl-D-alanine carboxypeptidase family protein [Loktanella sp. DSM 29012]SEQ56086.1 D-alanyl-D-alanine carboxypeptidase (penicillin-binding protein 5/6) [Loktanella sp. DSM 29012]
MTQALRIAALALSLLGSTAMAQQFETSAGSGFVMDMTTGTVLLEKNADAPLPPASMSKLMTIYMAFEAVADGRLRIDEELPVSAHAASYGGSSMFLDTTDRVTVEDLLRGVIVLSGNDASTVLAEALSPDGTEAGFARMMTARAREMGMNNSTFANSSGWPDPSHRMSMRDLGILAERLIVDFPTFYPIFAEQEFLFDGRVPSNSRNRNPILGLGIGADGLKTGHTSEAGYGLVGSAKQDGRRIIFVLSGMDTPQERAEESEKIVNWAFRQFAQREVAASGVRIATADVWMGETQQIGLTVAEDLQMLVPTTNGDTLNASVSFSGPVQAPITAGQTLGELVIEFDGLPDRRVPLVADSDVARGGFMPRMRTAAQVLLGKVTSRTADPAAAAPADAEEAA